MKTYVLVTLGMGAFERAFCRKLILWVRFGFIPIGGKGGLQDPTAFEFAKDSTGVSCNPRLEFA